MSSALPKGFFDDDRRQIAVEGVSIYEQDKLLEKNLKDEVKGFFNEINDSSIADLAAKEEEEELVEKEVEEEGVQLAYMAKLAVLMQKVSKKKNADISSGDAIKEQADKLIASITGEGPNDNASESGDAHNSSSSSSSSKICNDLAHILEKKRGEASRKRKLESATVSGEYRPLDLTDFTSLMEQH